MGKMNGSKGANLSLTDMMDGICGYGTKDGYKVVTDKHTYHILISNGQSCCENWGYMSSEDDLDYFVGAELLEVNLTDTELNKGKLDKQNVWIGDGGVQFVDFVTDKGTLQLAVYNGHNGYYGHSILVAKDNEILLSDTI
jgi:hypothetical protein